MFDSKGLRKSRKDLDIMKEQFAVHDKSISFENIQKSGCLFGIIRQPCSRSDFKNEKIRLYLL